MSVRNIWLQDVFSVYWFCKKKAKREFVDFIKKPRKKNENVDV